MIIPTDSFGAAEALVDRHPWLKHLVMRVVRPAAWATDDWLDELAAAVRDVDAHTEAMRAYESRHPAPTDDADYDRWIAAGPQLTPTGREYAVMFGGEQRILRLLATLAPARVGWSVDDLTGLDARGTRIVADWLQIVRARLAAWHFDTDPSHLCGGEAE